MSALSEPPTNRQVEGVTLNIEVPIITCTAAMYQNPLHANPIRLHRCHLRKIETAAPLPPHHHQADSQGLFFGGVAATPGRLGAAPPPSPGALHLWKRSPSPLISTPLGRLALMVERAQGMPHTGILFSSGNQAG